MEIAHYLFLLKDAGLPCSSVVKNPNANAGKAEDAGPIPGLGRKSLEKEMATHSSIVAGKSHGQRSFVGDSSQC